ncbi:MAG: hypothetical protein D6736_18450, partial [Nitrospinota bacterium]
MLHSQTRGLIWGLGVLLVAGIGTFVLGLLWLDPLRVWQTFLVNWLFWSNMAQGGLIFAAIYH